MTNDNQPTEALPEGVEVYDHTKYNKDQKLRMLLSAFSQGLQIVGQMCKDQHAKEGNSPATTAFVEKVFVHVDQTGQHAHSIMGGKDPDFHDDDVTGSRKRKYIPVKEIMKVLTDEYKLGGTSCDDEVNETIDHCLTALGFDLSKDEG